MPEFPPDFDQVLRAGDDSAAFFGRDVLRGLTEGIGEEQELRAANGSDRRWGTAVLGCAMWMDDPQLLAVLQRCESSCVVVTKQPRDKRTESRYAPLRAFAANAQGLAQAAFPELAELAPTQNGRPVVVGPHTPRLDGDIPAVRELGFRRVDNRLVPIVHAKIALVGHMRWTDEHPSGYLVDEIYFEPRRLWVGSANFTASSRRSLEMGMWTFDASLLRAARRFLLGLIAASEPLGTAEDTLTPELVPVDYDDAAMLEYLRETGPYVDDLD